MCTEFQGRDRLEDLDGIILTLILKKVWDEGVD